MRAKTFFYSCAAILLLVVTYTIAARGAAAQSGAQFVGIATDASSRMNLAITATGDVYGRQGAIQCGHGPNSLGFVQLDPGCPDEWVLIGNILGGTTAMTPSSLSTVKPRY